MEKSDVVFQVLLSFLEDPSLEVNKIKSVRVFYLFCLQPLDKKWEVLRNFFPNKDSIDHMAAKESHLDFVSSMRVNSSVLVDRFENIGRG